MGKTLWTIKAGTRLTAAQQDRLAGALYGWRDGTGRDLTEPETRGLSVYAYVAEGGTWRGPCPEGIEPLFHVEI